MHCCSGGGAVRGAEKKGLSGKVGGGVLENGNGAVIKKPFAVTSEVTMDQVAYDEDHHVSPIPDSFTR